MFLIDLGHYGLWAAYAAIAAMLLPGLLLGSSREASG